MIRKPTGEEMTVKNPERSESTRKKAEKALRRDPEGFQEDVFKSSRIHVSGIDIAWNAERGTCTFENLPVAMMWVDTTLAGLMAGVQAMVGTERSALALQSEGRKSVEADWQVISQFPDFREGFKAIANIAAVAGWGEWVIELLDEERKECRFRVRDSWEGRYQRALGVCWGSAMLAGKMAGYCSKLFGTNCWAEQTAFIAKGEPCDEFAVKASPRSIEKEIEGLLASDEATRADMAVALQKLEQEIAVRRRAEETLRESEEKYRSLFENAVEGILIAQGDRIKFANPALQKLFGWSNRVLTSKPFIEFIHPDDRELVLQRHLRRMAGEEVETGYEFRVITGAGEEKWVAINSSRTLWEGKPSNLSFLMDITERKQAEEALREREEETRRLAHESSTMAEIGRIISSSLDIDEVYERFAGEMRKLIPFDRIGISIVDVEKWTGVTNYTAGKEVPDRKVGIPYSLEGTAIAEVVRTGSSVLVQTDDLLEVKNRFPKLQSTFQAGFRSVLNVPLIAKGQIIGVLLLRSVLSGAYNTRHLQLAERVGRQIAGTIAGARLYAERKQVEEILRQSEEKYRIVVENAGEAISVAQEGILKFANARTIELMGLTSKGGAFGTGIDLLIRGDGSLEPKLNDSTTTHQQNALPLR
jgi:PAS domain S-box-containing protein